MSVVHVLPVDDLICHEDSVECVCGPTLEWIEGEDGDGWVVLHHSLDGRELREELQDEDE